MPRLETTETPGRIRILVVDDHTLFRESVARLLAVEPDFEIAGHCASAADALRLVAKTPVDVVLLDYDLGDGKGTDFLAKAQSVGFTGRILVVTAGVSELEAAAMIRQGIAGILRKHCSPAALAQSIRDGLLRTGLPAVRPGGNRGAGPGVSTQAAHRAGAPGAALCVRRAGEQGDCRPFAGFGKLREGHPAAVVFQDGRAHAQPARAHGVGEL